MNAYIYNQEESDKIREDAETIQMLVELGVLRQRKITTVEYKFQLTDHGKALGYKQNKHGTILPPL